MTICAFIDPVVSIRFSLSTIPLLVDEPLEPKSPDQPLELVVDIANEDLSRFMDCLEHRRMASFLSSRSLRKFVYIICYFRTRKW